MSQLWIGVLFFICLIPNGLAQTLRLPEVESAESPGSKAAESPAIKIDAKGRIKIPDGGNAILRYPDGTRIQLFGGAELQIESDGGPAADPDVRSHELLQGQVRVKVVPSKTPTKRPRFLIRTKSVVLGVRGTEFVMQFDSVTAQARAFGLEGKVELAQRIKLLGTPQGVTLGSGQSVLASPEGLGAVSVFDVAAFEAALPSPWPAQGSSLENAVPPAPSTELGVPVPAASATPTPTPSPTSAPSPSPSATTSPAPVASSPQAAEAEVSESPAHRSFHLLDFRFNVVYLPDLTRATVSLPNQLLGGGVGWAPQIPFPLIPFFSLRLEIDFWNAQGNWVADVGASLALHLWRISLEGVGGIQGWINRGNPMPLVLGRVAITIMERGFLHQIFLAAGPPLNPWSMSQVRAGLVLRLL